MLAIHYLQNYNSLEIDPRHLDHLHKKNTKMHLIKMECPMEYNKVLKQFQLFQLLIMEKMDF